jgi:hypothetical protein
MSPIFAKEIVCIPNSTNTVFDEVVMTQTRGNKYSFKVIKDENTLLTDTVSNTYLRRQRISRYRNKNQDVVIKTLKLYPNKATRASIKVGKLDSGSFSGLCKLYN